MLIEDARMCESLRRIVNGFTGDLTLQQDMLQECLICLWKIESEKPGRTRSWYLQNCRFHVQHWLAAGRSLDSHKRAHGGNRIALHGTEEDPELDGHHTNGELFETVIVRDLVSTLTPLLKAGERTVLRGLAEGLILREIALKSGISYPTALKYRRRIATLASRLGVSLPRGHTDGDSFTTALQNSKAQVPIEYEGSGYNPPVSRGSVKAGRPGACHGKVTLAQIKQAKLKTIPGKDQLGQKAGQSDPLRLLRPNTTRRLAA